MNRGLWTKNFCLVTIASIFGSAGAIAGGFALSILVFDETGSTFASAVIISVHSFRWLNFSVEVLEVFFNIR